MAAALGLYGLYQYVYLLPELVASPEAWSGLSKDELFPVLTRMAGGRVFSRFALPSTFSCVLLAAVPFLDHRIRHSETLWPWSLLLLLTTLNLILARSFAAVLLFCLYWWADAWIRHPAARWKVSAPAAAACVLAIFLLRPESLLDVSAPANPIVLRWANWKVAVHEWMSAPWFGVGPGNFSLLFPAYTSGLTETRYAHGFHMTILAETGLAGLATAVALLAYLAGWIRRAGPSTPALASLALVLAYSLVDIVFELPSLSFLFFLLLGLTIPAPVEPGRSVRRAMAAFAAAGVAFSLVLYFADGYYEQGMNALTSTRSSRQTYQAAGRHFERAGRLWPAARVDAARGQGELALARVEHNLHRLNAALHHLTNAVAKSPATVNYRVALAETLLEMGDPARALIHFKEAARLDPRGPHAGRYTKILLDQMPAPPVP
ncbi:MAG: hypothetical protein A3I06_07805 [Candidatus Lindowbacteria bacterium RIFCSPLOWO2_02_FULL_62_12]|nr:MAG: hypothetical protein A3I06_07805 [Candidatus Lindowbacteria bacterium RIFCSPLOWO2_02_FULL_62_12]